MGSRLRAAWYLIETIAVAPGIVAHEYAHVAACRAFGVAIHASPSLNPLAADAYLDHAPVDSFPAELAIAAAPLAANTPLALAAFAVAARLGDPRLSILALWLGACFGLTALPSPADADGLFAVAGELPLPVRPAGYLLAAPVRALSAASVGGVGGLAWCLACYAVAP